MTHTSRAAVPTVTTKGSDGGDLVTDERDLVARIRAGDESAFAAVFDSYYDRLVAYTVRYVRVPTIAEEAVQDLFLSLWRARATWELRDGSLTTYLYQAIRNRALNHLKRQRLEGNWVSRIGSRNDDEMPEFVGGTRIPAAQEMIQATDLASAAQVAISKLAPRCRETYILVRQHGLTYAQAAEVMGTAENTVKIQMHRALATLRKQLAHWLP